MQQTGFFITLAAALFSAVLLGWNEFNGYGADWVYGFLAVLWSLLMVLRLMTLTTPNVKTADSAKTAQKILGSFFDRQEENRQKILETSFGGSFALFLFAGFLFAAWLGFCAAYPARSDMFGGLQTLLETAGPDISISLVRAYDWGQLFMLFMAFAMMGFVVRSHAGNKGIARPALIALCGYALAGFIAFSGLDADGKGLMVTGADMAGSGVGTSSFIIGPLAEGKSLSLFEILLIESGVGGLALMGFLVFIPLGYLCLSSTGDDGRRDWLTTGAGLLIGCVMILSAFIGFTPAFGGFLALCWVGLFLAWGLSESQGATLPA